MTTLREAAQQALWALEEFGTHYEYCPRYPTWARPELQPPCNCGLDSNVVALRTALAQQEQEPTVRYKCTVVDDQHPNGVPFERWVNAPQQDEPKGGGKLPPPLQAEPVEEPVAWRHKGAGHFTVTPLVSKFPEWEPLYTAPPHCPNCASLEAQNTELDRKLAELG
jgi:hypothetical protein